MASTTADDRTADNTANGGPPRFDWRSFWSAAAVVVPAILTLAAWLHTVNIRTNERIDASRIELAGSIQATNERIDEILLRLSDIADVADDIKDVRDAIVSER